MKKLTIGSAVYDDFDGIYFSFQSLRLNNQDILNDLDLIVIDNNPDSPDGQATKHFCNQSGIRYIPYITKNGTSIRNEIFHQAQGEFCMSIDCHVLFEFNTIKSFLKYCQSNKTSKNLLQGPMLYDSLGNNMAAKMTPIWRSQMYGIWDEDERAVKPTNKPFEIDMHGLGIFACRTDSWLGFSDHFIGFGGEEGYIHTKYKQAGHKTLCLPFLRWLHRFGRPRGVPYPLLLRDKLYNYFIGRKELGLPFDDVIEHFNQEQPDFNMKPTLRKVQLTEI